MSELITRENAKQAICECCYMFKYIGDSYTECKYYPCDDVTALEAVPEAPSGDRISRADAIDAVIEYWDGYAKPLDSWDVMNRTRAVLETLPSAETHEIRTDTHEIRTETHDIISRERTLRAINGYLDTIPYIRNTMADMGRRDATIRCIDIVRALPSAEAVQGWIPCSERLPNEDGRYLVTYPLLRWQNNWINLMYYGKPSMPNCEVKGKCFYVSDDEWGDVVYDNIIAWMPLPTLYKGGDSE